MKKLAFSAVVCYTKGSLIWQMGVRQYAASVTTLGTADAALVSGASAARLADGHDENCDIFRKRRHPLADNVFRKIDAVDDLVCRLVIVGVLPKDSFSKGE